MSIKRVTSHDVARRAGVSRAAVSLILNRSSSVAFSQETRERVMRAATELGYTPNSAARTLVKGHSETIGLVISDMALLPVDGFIPGLLQGISEVNNLNGFQVLLSGMSNTATPEGYTDLVEARRADGLIVLNPRSDDSALRSLIDRQFPVVLVGSIRHPKEVRVTYAEMEAILPAVDYITSLGHARIGAISFSPPGFIGAVSRMRALEKALKLKGLDLPEEARAYGDFSAGSGYDAAMELLTRRPDLTAVFAGNDTIALGVLRAAAELGRRVPQDLSVIGFDDLPFAEWLTPPLTTIRTSSVRQGALAAEMLIAIIKGEPLDTPNVKLATEFVVRGSCAPVAG